MRIRMLMSVMAVAMMSAAAMAAGEQPGISGAPWVLTAMDGAAVAATRPPTVTFTLDNVVRAPALTNGPRPLGARLHGFAGCNTFFGAYSLAPAGKIRVTMAGMTLMACDEAAMKLEGAFSKSLVAAATWEWRAGDALVLAGADGKSRLEFARPSEKAR